MSNIVNLDEQSFYLDTSGQGAQRQTLKLRMGRSVLVLFTMPRCRGCNAFKPKFQQLAANQAHLIFAIADLSILKNVVQLSRASSTPLQSVPTLILYADGTPRAKFKGSMNIASVESFLRKGLAAISSRRGAPATGSPGPTGYRPQPPQQGSTLYGPANTRGGGEPAPNRQTYAALGNPEDEDDVCLLMPNGVCPHNQPWSSEFNQV